MDYWVPKSPFYPIISASIVTTYLFITLCSIVFLQKQGEYEKLNSIMRQRTVNSSIFFLKCAVAKDTKLLITLSKSKHKKYAIADIFLSTP